MAGFTVGVEVSQLPARPVRAELVEGLAHRCAGLRQAQPEREERGVSERRNGLLPRAGHGHPHPFALSTPHPFALSTPHPFALSLSKGRHTAARGFDKLSPNGRRGAYRSGGTGHCLAPDTDTPHPFALSLSKGRP